MHKKMLQRGLGAIVMILAGILCLSETESTTYLVLTLLSAGVLFFVGRKIYKLGDFVGNHRPTF